MTFESTTHYKYRSYSAFALELLVNREIYFASPTKLNDPYDCRINIRDSLGAAIARARSMSQVKLQERLRQLELSILYKKMDEDLSKVGVFSLSRTPIGVLMWSHYAANHSGFCIGFRFSDRLTALNNPDDIIGATDVPYCASNPFTEYFNEIASKGEIPDWDKFWGSLMSIGMTAKAEFWKHEEEVRILRKTSGIVQFTPPELVEIVFGLTASLDNRKTIRRILSGAEWAHVHFKEITRAEGFSLEMRDAN